MTALRESVPAALAGERIDRVVALLTERSRAEVADLIAAGAVRLGGVPVTARSHRVHEGDVLEVDAPAAPSPPPRPEPGVAVTVTFQDDDVVVVDKPAGLVVHPGAGQESGTLVNGLLARFPEMASVGEPARPGIVHRLDKGTSGLLAVARTAEAYRSLVAQLQARTVERAYLALAHGTLDEGAGVIDAPIGRSGRDPTRMSVSAGGRSARTHYRVQARYGRPFPATLLECRLETGRTHQIRVHLAAIDHPVVGDRRYRGAAQAAQLTRPFLHAFRLAFDQPRTGERIAVRSPLPPDLEEVHGQFQ